MNLNQYQKETLRTFAYRDKPLEENITDMLHCAIGISSEIGELFLAYEKKDVVNIGEEIADQMWYISNLANFLNVDLYNDCCLHRKDYFGSEMIQIKAQTVLSSELLDIFKKSIFYGKELNKISIVNILKSMIQELYDLCNSINLNFEEILNNNIEKLKIRFPDKFTQEYAENRNLDEERKALEGNNNN